jgi:hypothetical protein
VIGIKYNDHSRTTDLVIKVSCSRMNLPMQMVQHMGWQNRLVAVNGGGQANKKAPARRTTTCKQKPELSGPN